MRANGVYNEDRVKRKERNRIKKNIRSRLKDVEGKLWRSIAENLSKALQMANSHALYVKVYDWLAHGRQNELVKYLSARKLEKLSRFGNNLSALGVKVDADDCPQLIESENGCKWVPATFSQLDGRSVYCGVALLPKLNVQRNKGFKGFQASARDAAGGGSGNRGKNGGRKGKKGCRKGKKSGKDKILQKYGHGKGWPGKPKRVGKTYFGRPGTGMLFYGRC